MLVQKHAMMHKWKQSYSSLDIQCMQKVSCLISHGSIIVVDVSAAVTECKEYAESAMCGFANSSVALCSHESLDLIKQERAHKPSMSEQERAHKPTSLGPPRH